MNAPMHAQMVGELRIPPHSVDAEQAVLGALMVGGEAVWDKIADVVVEVDFYRDDHRRIFRHAQALITLGKPVDILTLSDSITTKNEVDQTGGLAYLAEVAASVVSMHNVKAHAATVAEKARLRKFIAVADEVQGIAQAPSNQPSQDRIDEATGKLMALAESGTVKDEPRQVAHALGDAIRAIEKRLERGGEVSGLPTGFKDADEMLDGLKGGDLIIVAGRPSMGKTAFALNIAENVALNNKPALIFSMEMGDTQLATRCLSSVGKVNGKALASGRLTDDDWDRVTIAMGKMHEAPLVIDQSAQLTVSQMRARARRQKRKGGLALVVIDYLQLMSGKGNNRNEELGDITRGLKAMARDLDVPVICLSQLSREVEKRGDKRPILSDLRESGAIEQDADVVMMLYRDDYYDKQSPFKGLAELLIRKNRMGACGDIHMVFQPEFSRFCDADRGELSAAFARASEAPKRRSRYGSDD